MHSVTLRCWKEAGDADKRETVFKEENTGIHNNPQ